MAASAQGGKGRRGRGNPGAGGEVVLAGDIGMQSGLRQAADMVEKAADARQGGGFGDLAV